MGSVNSWAGPIEGRGNQFDRTADGRMLARDVPLKLGYEPRKGQTFAGTLDRFGAVSASVLITYPGHVIDATATKMPVTVVNNVGYLGTNAAPAPGVDAGPDLTQANSSCTTTSTTPPLCTDFMTQGTPPAGYVQSYYDTYCTPVGAPVTQGTSCDGGMNGIPAQAQCTIIKPESWGTFTLYKHYYGVPADPAAEMAACSAAGGFYSST